MDKVLFIVLLLLQFVFVTSRDGSFVSGTVVYELRVLRSQFVNQ